MIFYFMRLKTKKLTAKAQTKIVYPKGIRLNKNVKDGLSLCLVLFIVTYRLTLII